MQKIRPRKEGSTLAGRSLESLPGTGGECQLQPLPRRLRFIAEESTNSFVHRLAETNGLNPRELLAMLGEGDALVPEPEFSEVHLNVAAGGRLAALAGCTTDVLAHVLPTLRAHPLPDPDGAPPRWDVPNPWEPVDDCLVRVCDLCALAKRAHRDAYAVSAADWRVCARHRRWMDNLREDGVTCIPLTAVPEVLAAQRERVRLERRLGAGGRIAFADAFHIAVFWWNQAAQVPRAWAERHQQLGLEEGSDRRVAALVAYPEVVQLAGALAARERRRLRGSWSRAQETDWLRGVQALFASWELRGSVPMEPVLQWAALHSGRARLSGPKPVRGRYRRLGASGPHPQEAGAAALETLTCLPWRLGDIPETPAQLWSVSSRV
ncbi:TniQ family protein [Streptomyces sp. BK205]|uniref:TniQ family protein n=1 Tax=Streptomyces sp. BK205 TaxID=2512164 RepID=UPI001404D979|nr:TniQ family protein [Streptomyces sp. BK205]